jgi:apolipoprotein N-acyltransferase
LELTRQARDQHPDLDLIVWPESVFTAGCPDVIVEGSPQPPAGSPLTAEQLRAARMAFDDKTRQTAERLNRIWQDGEFRDLSIPMLVGSQTVWFGAGEIRDYNSALLLNPQGDVLGRYFKMHPVMFGEYVPFGDVLPWLYRLTPLRQGLSRGEEPQTFKVGELRFAPSICFESTVPHLIRSHVVRLTRAGTPPDVLVNLTDDGWFWGSSILDLQLACAVFRAVELRRPFLVAANTGLSAHIDGSGVIRQRGPRRDQTVLVAQVTPDGRWSGYQCWGDWPAIVCLAACLVLVGVALARRWRSGGRVAGGG